MAFVALDPFTAGEVLTAAIMEKARLDFDFLRGETAWNAPTYQNSWANYGNGFENGGYRLIGDLVYIRGAVTGGTNNTVIFTLPVGYRPANRRRFPVARNNNVFGIVDVLSNGQVVGVLSDITWTFMDGIVFSIV